LDGCYEALLPDGDEEIRTQLLMMKSFTGMYVFELKDV
jgi:hypothetical protein